MDDLPDPREEHALEERLTAIQSELTRISRHHYLRAQRTWGRMIAYNLVRGMAFGLGSLLGATVLVYIIVSILSQMASHIDFIPLVGDWVTKILEIVEAGKVEN